MFSSGQDTICRWLSSLLSTTQWVCCPFCEPANDIPWKRSQFWGLKFAGVFKRASCDMLCMTEKNFQGILFLANFAFFPKFYSQALAVCQRKGLRPRLSIAPESPQVMAVMLTVGSRGEEVAYLLGRAGRVSDALRTVFQFGDSEIHDGSWADICRLHDHVFCWKSYTDEGLN